MNTSIDRAEYEKSARQYLMGKKVLLVDHSAACREGIKDLLIDLGAEESLIQSALSLKKAFEIVERYQPSIVVSEFRLGQESALELSPKMNNYLESRSEKLFMIVTSNATESAVAEAAEGEVDAYILKPFSRHHLQDFLLKVIYPKMNPSPYLQLLEKGKSFLSKAQWDSAESCFQQALVLTEKPSSIYFYLGKIQEQQNRMEAALNFYQKGITFNPLHFRCLGSKLDVLEKLQKYNEAYSVAQVLNNNFPMSPLRLGKAIQLAVYTQNFSDVQKLYDKFKKLEYKTTVLTKIVSAALHVCGKFLIQREMSESALKAFRDSIATDNHEPTAIERSVKYLAQVGNKNGAESLLKLYPSEKRHESHFQSLEQLVSSLK